MANRFDNPNLQFADNTGTPYAGGSLTFYASGTTTPLNTYSDKALTIANPNPVVLDSAGRAGSIFLQNLAYKVVLSDVNNNVIWTEDPVFQSDFSTVAQFQSGSGSPNGVLAGSAGSSTIPASSYWDALNQILYVCTQTGNAATAVWTAINSNSAANIIIPPQGYLTLTTGTPIINSDVTSATVVYYTPLIGNQIPIYNGTSFTVITFSEIFCSLVSAHAANTIYDLFVFNNSGVVTLVTGPAWSSSTAGSCSRGTGAGTTQLSRVNGIWVNTVSMTGRNGSTTYTIAASQATYVGSLYTDATAGQVSCYFSGGSNRKWGVWNAYNRQPITIPVVDPNTSWSYSSVTIRASDASPGSYSSTAFNAGSGTSCNGGAVFMGLAEERADIRFIQTVNTSIANAQVSAKNYIGINSITVASGKSGQSQWANASGTSDTYSSDIVAEYLLPPTLGLTNFCGLESSPGAFPISFQGTSGSMLLTATYRG